MGRVSVTSDLWSDSNLSTFMAVTLHWIEQTSNGDLQLCVALGAFRNIKDRHSGENIGKSLFEVFEELDILHRVSIWLYIQWLTNVTRLEGLQWIMRAIIQLQWSALPIYLRSTICTSILNNKNYGKNHFN
jgi:hypothetical protein